MNKSDVFISYRRKDKEFTKQLDQAFKQAGREVWVDWEDIPPGSIDFTEEIRQGIEGAETFLLILSPDYLESPHCLMELEYAEQHSKKLIPVIWRDVDPGKVPPSISHINWVYFNKEDNFEQAFTKTIAAIDTDLDFVRTHTRLTLRAREWEKNHNDQGFLLIGNDLFKAEEWLAKSPGLEPQPSELQRQYIAASRKARNARNRVITIATAVTLLIIGLAVTAAWQGYQANRQRKLAEQNAREAQSLALAGSSLVLMEDNNTDLALVLALKSAELDASRQEAERALAAAAYAPGTVRVMAGHEKTVAAFDWLPDGVHILSVSEDITIRLWDTATGQELRQFDQEHTDGITTVDVSSDGTRAITGSRDTTAIIWDVESGRMLHRLADHHTQRVRSVALSNDGRYAVTGGYDALINIWDANTGAHLRTLEGHRGQILSINLSNDSQRIVSSGQDAVIRIWDIETGRMRREFTGHNGLVSRAVFSPNGEQIISCGEDVTVRVWDTQNGRLQRTLYGHTDYIYGVEVSDDGRFALTASSDDSIILWDLHTGEMVSRLAGHQGAVREVDFAPNSDPGAMLAVSASEDLTLRLWDVRNGARGQRYSSVGDIYSLLVTPDGTRLVTGGAGSDASIQIWDTRTPQQLDRLEGHNSLVRDVDISDDGENVLTASYDNRAIYWNLATGEPLLTLRNNNDVWAVDISTDKKWALTGDARGRVMLWSLETGEVVHTMTGHEENVMEVKFAPDGISAFSSGYDYTIRQWNLETGEQMNVLEGHTDYVGALAFSPDGKILASGGEDNRIIFWDVETMELVRYFTGHVGPVNGIAFSPDGTMLASGSSDKTVRIWNAETALEIRRFRGHTDNIRTVIFSPDGKRVYSAGLDNTILVWNIHSGAELREWALSNRYIRPLTCIETRIYNVEAECVNTTG